MLILISATEDNSIGQVQSKHFKKVVKKVFDFFKLQRNRKKASSIIKLGEHLKLRGDFKVFEEIENEVYLILLHFCFVLHETQSTVPYAKWIDLIFLCSRPDNAYYCCLYYFCFYYCLV